MTIVGLSIRMHITNLLCGILVVTSTFGCAGWALDDQSADEAVVADNIHSLNLGKNTRLDLVFIQGGTFVMGSDENDPHRLEHFELSAHEVEVENFWIGRFEITNRQYAAIMGKDGVDPKSDVPVTHINWREATEFCRRLSARTGWTFSLPTEAQWEYACRAGSTTQFAFEHRENLLQEYAWYSPNDSWEGKGPGYPQPVGQKRPNKWGLYDMHGNVYEWCSDRYIDDYFVERDKDPEDKRKYERLGLIPRVIKGGCWGSPASFLRCAHRAHRAEVQGYIRVGFRVVALPPANEPPPKPQTKDNPSSQRRSPSSHLQN